MPECNLQVSLIAHTPNPEKTCALAARTCYSGEEMDALQKLVAEKDQAAFLKRILASGHLSVLEHASFTFAIQGVSRTLLAQVTRHRIASFSVQSQRYVSLADGFGYIVPPRIRALGEEAVAEFEKQMDTMQTWYQQWQEKLG
ncbi:MAG: FAD-dependent thymidylate synthase, partial [Clostridiales bacterium]|nr:FAD-dependent thymidylate synthase [Clostridiales bacterium]